MTRGLITPARGRIARLVLAILATPPCRRPSGSASIYLVRADDDQPQDLTPWQKILLAEYQEVCKSHSGITDFRAKLLALLPIASVTGVGLLVAQNMGEASGPGPGPLIGLATPGLS